MTTRRALTTLDKLKIMVRQAVCPACGEKLGNLGDCEFDHEHSLAMGGEDDLDNLRAKHVDCHAKKTARDAAARAKVKRITGKTKTRDKADRFKPRPTGVDVYEPDDHASVSRPKRDWPKGRKIPSRGFDQSAKRRYEKEARE